MEILKPIITQLLLRLYMIVTRSFVVTVLFYAHYNQPNYLYIVAACISLPLVFVALWRLVETIQILINIAPNIGKVHNEFVKEQNKQYKKEL